MPDYATLMTSVTDFMADYVVFAAVGVAVGLLVWGAKKFVKIGR